MNRSRQILLFLGRSMTLGLAVAFVVIWLRPDWLSRLGANTANAPDPELSMLNLIPDAVASAAPAVVNIYTTRAINPGNLRPLSRFRLRGNSGADTPPMVTSLGSGVVIDPAGFIATNHHVVAASRDIKVQLADGRVAQAQTIGTDTDTDLALLKIDLDDLPSMPLGRSDQIRIGEIVLAIGNPYGLSQTVTQGIVSATGRTELGVTRFENFIQTDAAINVGNSGGALVNLRGELIGINTAVLGTDFSTEGISFAIPSNMVRGVVAELRTHGRVRRGWLGVVPKDLSNRRAAELGLPEMGGIELVDVFVNSPAARIGLRPGDVITHINEQPIRFSRQALNLIASLEPGVNVKVSGNRNGKSFSAAVTLDERPRSGS
ncbi:MAG: trypsin-like peptidase domain-containing protein [Gammaproteobacteria bacterium]|jgi:serine peptidase DegS